MKKQHKDIGSIYKEAFRDFRPTPPPTAMNQIMAHPEVRQMAHWTVKWMQPVLWTAGAAMVALSAYFLWPDPVSDTAPPGTELAADTPAPVHTIPLDSEPALQDTETQQIKKTDKDLLADSPITPAPQTFEKPGKTASKPLDANADKKSLSQEIAEEKPLLQQPITKTESKEPDTPSSLLDRHRLQRAPRDLNPLPEVVLSETQYVCKGESIDIGASGGIAYAWNTGEKTQTIHVKPSMTSLYKVTVTRPDRRKVSGEIWVNVEDCAALYVPNAFTPNNDGLNDIFMAYGKNLTSFHIEIFSATGEVLFESTDIAEGWDGTYLGAPVETGNYFYRIVYVDAKYNQQSRNGRITLLR